MWPACGDHSFPPQTGVQSGQAQEDNALSAPSSSGGPSAHAQVTEQGSLRGSGPIAHAPHGAFLQRVLRTCVTQSPTLLELLFKKAVHVRLLGSVL